MMATLYFRSDTASVNGQTAYKLLDSQSSSSAQWDAWAEGDYYTTYACFRVLIRASGGTETVISGWRQGQVSRSFATGGSIYSATYSFPGVSSMNATDCLVVEVGMGITSTGTPAAVRKFSTGQLGVTALGAGTWTWYWRIHNDEDAEFAYGFSIHGNSTYNARIEGIDLSQPADPPDVPSYVDAQSDIYGGVSVTFTVSDAASVKLFRAASENGTYAEVTAGFASSDGDDWTVIDSRPDYDAGLSFGDTAWYKVKAVNSGGESEYTDPVSVVFDYSPEDVLSAHADQLVSYSDALLNDIEPMDGSYVAWPLGTRAIAWADAPSAARLALVEAQWEYVLTKPDANGIIGISTGRDVHWRNCWYTYMTSRILRAGGQTTLADEMLGKVDEWAQNWLDLHDGTTPHLLGVHYAVAQVELETVQLYGFTGTTSSGAAAMVQAPNKELWPCSLFAMLLRDSNSAFYNDTTEYAVRGSAITKTLAEVIESTIHYVRTAQIEYDQGGKIPWETSAGSSYTSGYHTASMISLVLILNTLGANANEELDAAIAAGIDLMQSDSVFTTEDSSVEWLALERFVFSGTSESDPLPWGPYTWSVHKRSGANMLASSGSGWGLYEGTDYANASNAISVDSVLTAKLYEDVAIAVGSTHSRRFRLFPMPIGV